MSVFKVQGDRGITFRYRFKVQGRPFQRKGFPTKELARHAEDTHRRELQTAGHEAIYGSTGPKLLTWAAALALYQAELAERERNKTSDQALARVRWWAAFAQEHGAGYVQALTPDLVEKGVRQLAQLASGRGHPLTKQTQCHYLARLKAFYNAIPIRRVCRDNPVTMAHRPRPPRYEARILTREERTRLLLAADPHMRRFATAAMYTGLREMAILEWTVEDFTTRPGWLRARDQKSGGTYYVPVVPQLDKVVQEIMHKQGIIKGRLWRHADGTVIHRFQKKAWLRALGRAGLVTETPRVLAPRAEGTPGPKPVKGLVKVTPAVRFHDLRHLVGVTLAEAGVPTDVIRAFLHHATNQASEIYRRGAGSDRALLAAAEQLATRLEQ